MKQEKEEKNSKTVSSFWADKVNIQKSKTPHWQEANGGKNENSYFNKIFRIHTPNERKFISLCEQLEDSVLSLRDKQNTKMFDKKLVYKSKNDIICNINDKFIKESWL